MQNGPDALKFESAIELRDYETLLQMADLTVHCRDLGELFPRLSERLREIVGFDHAVFSLHDPARNLIVVHLLPDFATPVREYETGKSISGWVWEHQQPLYIPDLRIESRFPDCLEPMREQGLSACCCVPLTTAHRRLGALGVANYLPNVYSEKDIRLLEKFASLVTMAVENALTRQALQQEKERLQMLLEVNATLVSSHELPELFPVISGFIRKVVQHDFASIALYDEESQCLRMYALDYPASSGIVPGQPLSLRATGPGIAFLERAVKLFNQDELAAFDDACLKLLVEAGVRSGCCVPLITYKGPLGVINLASRSQNAFRPPDIALLKQVASQVAIALDNAQAYRQIAQLKDKLTEEKRYLQSEIRSQLNFEEIIGESPALSQILDQAKTVAGSDATVLILGETGTGKELVARALHRMSGRKDASFIKLNCAAIPTGLLESELFGHEKGAFTGAISQKIGRLELADKGTLFLDEVGEIPLELQPKLLRVLQDQEFERLGSNRTIRVNVRVVAATNRDLAASVAHKQFRSDLFYRLNVFPLRMPALRERPGDIPLLVSYFVQKFSRRMGKVIESIPNEAMDAMANWHWPGNVRELENFVERSVILSGGPALKAPLSELRANGLSSTDKGTLENFERDYIVRVLRETGGVVSGMHGAAARLGLKRTTLQSMMSRMGISRGDYDN